VAVPPGKVPDLLEDAGRFEYLFFYGHRRQPDGSIGPGCLSQWWPARFVLDGREFLTAEHYMMWSKATLFNDRDAGQKILCAPNPRTAKQVGRLVQGFDQDIWERRRYDIVVRGSLAKFGQHRDLCDFLLATGDRVLVEASPTDRVWGIGLAAADERARDPARWRGLNLLGFALMQTRATLRGQDPRRGAGGGT
jgi:ribA/ribD-fused uncharacterized protein